MRPPNPFTLVSLLLWTLLATACQHQPEVGALFRTYGERLGNLLKRTPPPLAAEIPTEAPDRRELLQPLPEVRAGLLQILSLADCQLLNLVAERNSSLGKVSPPSHRFAYEVRFLRGIEACLQRPLPDDTRQWLLAVQRQKQAALPLQFWNMLWQTDTIYQQLLPYPRPLEPDSQPGRLAVIQLVDLLAAIGAQLQRQSLPNEARLARLETLLEQTRGSRYGGQLLYSLDYASAQLRQLNPFVTTGLATVNCRPGYSRQQYQYLQNVLNKFWGKQLQAYLAMLNRQYFAVADDLAGLLSLVHSPSLEAYRQRYASGSSSDAIMQLRHDTLEHVKPWQQLQQRCR